MCRDRRLVRPHPDPLPQPRCLSESRPIVGEGEIRTPATTNERVRPLINVAALVPPGHPDPGQLARAGERPARSARRPCPRPMTAQTLTPGAIGSDRQARLQSARDEPPAVYGCRPIPARPAQ